MTLFLRTRQPHGCLRGRNNIHDKIKRFAFIFFFATNKGYCLSISHPQAFTGQNTSSGIRRTTVIRGFGIHVSFGFQLIKLCSVT